MHPNIFCIFYLIFYQCQSTLCFDPSPLSTNSLLYSFIFFHILILCPPFSILSNDFQWPVLTDYEAFMSEKKIKRLKTILKIGFIIGILIIKEERKKRNSWIEYTRLMPLFLIDRLIDWKQLHKVYGRKCLHKIT